MGVGLSLYGLAALYQYFSKDPIIKRMVKCRYCRKRINEKVGEHVRGDEEPRTDERRLCGASIAAAGRTAERTGRGVRAVLGGMAGCPGYWVYTSKAHETCL